MIDKNTKHLIIEAARLYMQSNNLSQDAFTDHVKKMGGLSRGFSVAYLNDMLKGKLVTGAKQTQIDDKYFYRIAQAINFIIRKSFRKHHDTDNYFMCLNTFSDARDSKMPYAIDGPTGEGKSYAALGYMQQHPKNTYYVRCDGDLTAKSFFLELADSLQLVRAGTIFDIRKNVIHKLKNETDALLIIDEAENLKDRAWDSLKRVMDDLKGYTGLVFIGANEFENHLQKRADKMKACFPQVLRRLREGGINHLWSLTLEDAIGICKEYGITSKQHVRVLYDRCRNTGQLTAMIAKILREAEQDKKRNVLEFIELHCQVNLKMKVA